jgi:uncharacterized protein YgiM (DUF1202 family)
MSKIAVATAVVALTAAGPPTMGHAETQLVPAALPPWSTTTPTETEQPAPAPIATPATQPLPTSVEAGGTTPIQGTTTPIQAVSLRSGPSTGSPVIGTLRPGMAVQVRASANYGWMQVETPAGSGWTYGSYLAPVGNSVAPAQEIIAR